jgi:hypothetical protein
VFKIGLRRRAGNQSLPACYPQSEKDLFGFEEHPGDGSKIQKHVLLRFFKLAGLTVLLYSLFFFVSATFLEFPIKYCTYEDAVSYHR